MEKDNGMKVSVSLQLPDSQQKGVGLKATYWHPSPVELAKYLEGELDEVSTGVIKLHIEGGQCGQCCYMSRASLFYL